MLLLQLQLLYVLRGLFKEPSSTQKTPDYTLDLRGCLIRCTHIQNGELRRRLNQEGIKLPAELVCLALGQIRMSLEDLEHLLVYRDAGEGSRKVEVAGLSAIRIGQQAIVIPIGRPFRIQFGLPCLFLQTRRPGRIQATRIA